MRTEISPSKGHTAPPLSLASQSRSKHGALRLLLGVLLTVAVFSYLFSSISLRSVVRSLRDLEPTGIAVFVMLSLTASLARSWRYQLLLRSSGHVVGTRPLFLVTLVRNLCSDLLPARLGSAVYIYLATSRLHLPLSVATSSFGISLVFDIISLPPLMLFLLGNSKELGIPPLLLGGAVGIVIVLTGTLVYFSSYILRSLPPMKLPFPNSILKPLREIFEQAESDLFRLRSPLLFSHVYLLSILLRFLKYLSLVIFFYSLLLALDYPTESFSSAKAFIGILVSELAASLPISGIGGFGAYEGAWAVTFRLLGLPGWMADTTALTHHLFTQGYGYLLGLSALIALSLPKKRKTNEPREISRALSSAPVIGKHLLLLLMPIILSLFYLSEKRAAKATPPHTPQQLSAATPLSPLPEGIEVIFDSNQSGTFGIYLLSERGEVALVDSHAHEMYPA
ncbi:flippase-like domain-containing protein, partial [bacterium]|nr:flippase-like domain-containing protein [bacterium]